MEETFPVERGRLLANPLLDAVNYYGCFLIRSSGADVVPCVEAPKPSSGVLAARAPGTQRDSRFSAPQQTCLKRSRCIIRVSLNGPEGAN